MTYPWLAGIAGAAVFAAAAMAHPTSDVVSAATIAQALKGKTCMTRSGSYFGFAMDGHYEYDGLWRNTGHYAISPGVITIRLDNGLERSFAISIQDGVLYLGGIALTCESAAVEVASEG